MMAENFDAIPPKPAQASILSTLDISVFISSLTISVLIGLYFSNKNKTLDQYLLGGRDQKLIPVALSMMTSFVSGLTLIGTPLELYLHGSTYAFIVLPVILCVPISALIFLPVFYRLNNVSVFTYIELRYCSWIRKLVSLVFILQVTLYNAVVLYVPSMLLHSVFGISSNLSIGAVGLSCLIYCTIGGIKAVIWTDFFQAGLMYLSVICICVGGTIESGGIGKLFEANLASGRLSMEPLWNFDLTTRHTIYTLCLGGLCNNLFFTGANQIQVQRALSLPTLRLAQLAQLLTGLFSGLISLLSAYVGLILYNIYADCDPFDNHEINKRDALVVYYVATHLENFTGLRGIFVAGIFAATLSTLSSFQNSMSALVFEDFLKPLPSFNQVSESSMMWISKSLALFFGCLCIGLAFGVDNMTGLLQVASSIFGSSCPTFLATFLLGMLTRVTNTAGMAAGLLVGYSFGAYVLVYQTLFVGPVKPTMKLSTEGCSAGSHLTMMSPVIKSANSSLAMTREAVLVRQNENDLNFIGTMSYLWIPTMELVLILIVALVVSVLTGGLKQQLTSKNSMATQRTKISKVNIMVSHINSMESSLSRISIVRLAAWISAMCVCAQITVDGSDLTRATGLVYYPEHVDPNQPDSLNQSFQTNSRTKLRIVLTRNTSYPNSNKLEAPHVSYFGAVGFGSPAKMFNVVFDTNSGETWIPYYNWFPLANNLHYSDGYTCKDSSTCQALDQKFSFNYKNTRLTGETYEDKLTLYEDMLKDDAQLVISPTMSLKQNFIGVDDASDEQFRWKPYDGVVGLAPLAQSSSGVRNLLLSLQQEQQRQTGMMAPNGLPPSPYSQVNEYRHAAYSPFSDLIFAFWFNPNLNSRHGGELMIGGIDENRFSGDIHFHRINSYFSWQLPLTYVMIGGRVISCPNGCPAVLDTGVNSIVGPRQDVEEIYNDLQAEYNREADLWLVDCGRMHQLPVLTFKIEESSYLLFPLNYVRLFRYKENIVCYLAIKPWDQPSWLLGTTFVGAYYTVFDFAGRRVGFASPRN